jgi:transposase
MLQLLERAPASPGVVPNCTRGHRKHIDYPELQYRTAECSRPLVLREEDVERFWLNDAQWRAIAPSLPSRQTGPKRSDDRLIISGIVHVLTSGCAWRDCPSEYGPAMTVFNRFNRWKHRGLWKRISAILTDPALSTLSPQQRDALLAAESARAQAATRRASKDAAFGRLSMHQAWDEAAAQLGKIAHTHQGRPLATWIDAVVEWHMDALFAHLERNTPQTGTIAAEHDAQIASLRGDLLTAVVSLRAYIDDPRRNAASARQQLARLEFSLKQAALAAARSRRAS